MTVAAVAAVAASRANPSTDHFHVELSDLLADSDSDDDSVAEPPAKEVQLQQAVVRRADGKHNSRSGCSCSRNSSRTSDSRNDATEVTVSVEEVMPPLQRGSAATVAAAGVPERCIIAGSSLFSSCSVEIKAAQVKKSVQDAGACLFFNWCWHALQQRCRMRLGSCFLLGSAMPCTHCTCDTSCCCSCCPHVHVQDAFTLPYLAPANYTQLVLDRGVSRQQVVRTLKQALARPSKECCAAQCCFNQRLLCDCEPSVVQVCLCVNVHGHGPMGPVAPS